MGNFKKLELAVGAFVALGLAAFFMLAMKVSNIAELGEDKGYKITARFENIGGLKPGAPVSSVQTWACSWAMTASNGRQRAASERAFAAVPEATKRTSASASNMARTALAARALISSEP